MTLSTLRTALAAVALAAALAAAGCGGDDDEDTGEQAGGGGATTEQAEAATVKFMQPLPKSMAFYPFFVAEELGYFDEENLEVELLTGDGGGAVALQIASGNVDIGSAPAPDVLTGLSEGQEWNVVYNYYQGNVFSIVVPEDSDITAVADLKGKSLGITSQSGGEVGLVSAALNQANLAEDTDVKITVVGEGGPQVARALEGGSIDAFAGAIQDIPALQAAGLELRDITPEEYALLPSAPLFMRTDRFADEKRRDAVTRFLRAWAKATHVGIVNADAVFEMAKQNVPEETGDEAFARPFLDLSIKLQTPPGDTFGENQDVAWTTIQEMLVAGEVIPSVIPSADFVDEAVLEEVNDWDRDEVEAEAEAWVEENA
jgi:NitT/TauT family transport system substrate-binding protein